MIERANNAAVLMWTNDVVILDSHFSPAFLLVYSVYSPYFIFPSWLTWLAIREDLIDVGKKKKS